MECVGGTLFVEFVFVMESSRSRVVIITHTPNGRRHTTTFEARRIELKGFRNHHILHGRIFAKV